MSNKFYQAEAYAPASAGARDISEYGTQGATLTAAQDTTASHDVQFVSFTDADAAAVGYFNKVDNTTPLSAATDAHPVRVLVDSTSPFVLGTPHTFSGVLTSASDSKQIELQAVANGGNDITLTFNDTIYNTVTAHNANPGQEIVIPTASWKDFTPTGSTQITLDGGAADTGGLGGSPITCDFVNTPGDVSTFAAASANVTTPLSSGSGQIKFDSVHDGKTAAIIMQDRSSFEFTISSGSVTLTAVGIKDLGARERRLRTLGHY